METKEILKQVEDQQEKLESNEVMGKILFIMKKVEDTPITDWDVHSLVNHIFTLNKLMDNLSDLKEYAYIKSESLGEEYKSKVRAKYLELKKSGQKITDGLAKAEAEQFAESTKQEELVAIHQARRLRDLYENLSRLINFTQTKIKSMDDSRVRSNIDN